MTLLCKIAKGLSLLLGVGLCLLGVAWVRIAASGSVSPTPAVGFAAGAGFVIAAAPFLAFAFSTRAAKTFGVIALFGFAAIFLCLVFQPNSPAKRPEMYQAASIAFTVLLLARVGLALRRKRQTKLGT